MRASPVVCSQCVENVLYRRRDVFGAGLAQRRDRGWEQLCVSPHRRCLCPGHVAQQWHRQLCPVSMQDCALSGLHPAPLCRDRVPW